MPQFRYILPLVILVTTASVSEAQSASNTPLHLPSNRFEFVASGDAPPPSQALRIHNGGTVGFTDVRITQLSYADSTRAAWLVSLPRQSSVAPDELATVGTLCVNATGLPAGTYRATAAVAAREVPEPVRFTITLIVTDAGAKSGKVAGGCDPATK